MMRFVLDIEPPRTTAQQKRVSFRHDSRPQFYDGQKLAQARNTFRTALYPHRPKEPIQGPVALKIDWVFSTPDSRKWGVWKETRPDTDNMVKLFKDEMTRAGFWKDDAQVCVEHVEKYWDIDGRIVVSIEQIEKKRTFDSVRRFVRTIINSFVGGRGGE